MYVIRMAHPAKNALGSELMAWLEGELAAAGNQPILLTGTDDAFCAGLDLREVQQLQQEGGLDDFCVRMDRLASAIAHHSAPTVACVNGHAIAGGCVLVMCCDHRVATTNPKTRIGLNEVALGVSFPAEIMKLLVLRLPSQHRERLLLGAELHTPTEAQRLGLVDDLADDPEAVAHARLELLARHPRAGYARTKHVLRRATHLSEDERREFLTVDSPIWHSTEVAERMRAVLER